MSLSHTEIALIAKETARLLEVPLTAAALAKRWNLAEKSIAEAAREGRIPGHKHGGRWYFSPSELTQALTS